MKLINLHKKWAEFGLIPNCGLCYSLPPEYRNDMGLFNPTFEEANKHTRDGYMRIYWGEKWKDRFRSYNEFRQTIVLLICAMNNEL